jgi:hypothetical protein
VKKLCQSSDCLGRKMKDSIHSRARKYNCCQHIQTNSGTQPCISIFSKNKNMSCCTSTSPYNLMAWCLNKHKNKFTDIGFSLKTYKKKKEMCSLLCKISSFHGCGYEECRLLGYKNPVHTSQETHYVSATEPSWLMLCKI